MANYYEEDEEPVEKKTKHSYERKLAKLKELRDKHKGEWLTIETCNDYYNRAKAASPNDCQDT